MSDIEDITLDSIAPVHVCRFLAPEGVCGTCGAARPKRTRERCKIVVRGGRTVDAPSPSRGVDIGVFIQVEGKETLLPVTAFELRVDGRRAVATVNLLVDDVEVTEVESVRSVAVRDARPDLRQLLERFIAMGERSQGEDGEMNKLLIDAHRVLRMATTAVSIPGTDTELAPKPYGQMSRVELLRESRRRALADITGHRKLHGERYAGLGCDDRECPVCDGGAR